MNATGPSAVLFAAQWDPSFLWYGLLLAGTLLVGALMVEIVRRWRQQQHADRLSASDALEDTSLPTQARDVIRKMRFDGAGRRALRS